MTGGREVGVTPMAPGRASGPALVLTEPLSLWGGVEPETAVIVDRLHPQHGVSLTGAVVFMARGRGSSSASSILVEMVRLGTAPAAFVLRDADEMLVVGSLVAAELYDHDVPIVLVESAGLGGTPEVSTGDDVWIDGQTMTVRAHSA